ncbi:MULTISPECIES: hypothetical protein [unclassified Marinobacter]|uniref:hypothetical protein n=1 Tax=unclassified Marinobacter TaxID=83889 RepID=UPI0012691631|nr:MULTISPECIES: hypothetical protein [unclassified Marinobacter]QFS87440.1 hypothetical protein FIV08_11430 [Marinobacter sp. THAF197a]QFT51225.1 hypothetical protein FIU96_11345 [Marinobacter sp. THAF39]
MDVQEIAKVEKEKFQKSLADVRDPLSALLRTHLFIEQGLERIIRARLPQPEKLLTKARLTFNQKLLLVESFEILDEKTVAGIRKLNDIRNNCAHQLEARLSKEVIEKFGDTQRPWFTEVKKEHPDDHEAWLGRLLPRLAGKVGGFVLTAEHGPNQ